MSEQPEENALQIAERALEKDSYDPFARAEDRGYPVDEVEIYWDELSARALVAHNQKLTEQSNRIAIFNQALRDADEMKKNLDESRADYKSVLTAIQKAKRDDTKSAKLAQEEYDRLEAEGQDLKAKVEESKVTIGLSGFANEVTDAIHEKLNVLYPSKDGEPHPEWTKHFNAEIISAAIQWTQKNGEERKTDPISPAVVLGWRNKLPEESYLKLVRAASQVTLATGFFKSLEDAGFLAKS